MAIKLCVMTSVHPPFDPRIFHKECQSLARAGYRVTLIAPHHENQRCGRVDLRAFPSYSGRIRRIVKGSFAMGRAAWCENADVYHFHDPELIPVGLLLRACGKKVVYDVHEDLPKSVSHKPYIPRWLRGPLQIAVKIFEEIAGRLFSGIVAATPPIAQRFSSVKRRAVVHNYPLSQEFNSRLTGPAVNRENIVVYVGARITPSRGAIEMVRAMGALPPHLNVRLALAGAFDPAELPDTLSHVPGWNRTDCVGVLDRHEVARLLCRAKAGLVLLHPEPNYLTAQPTKLFEYMAAGIPVIVSDFPLWRTFIEDTGCGLVVNPLDPLSIARAIEYVWTHPAEALAMGDRGRTAVATRYNWGAEEKTLLEFYRRLLGSAHGTQSTPLEVHT